jgi:hypothetical protein
MPYEFTVVDENATCYQTVVFIRLDLSPLLEKETEMTLSLSTIATEAELFVNDFLTAFDQDSQPDSMAQLFTVRPSENEGVVVELVSSHPDVYELIDEVIAETPFSVRSSDILAILTSGWAAPLNANGEVEGMPSEHPQRRRVRLMACVRRSDLKMVSIVRFTETDETQMDEGSATGALADAMLALGDAGK